MMVLGLLENAVVILELVVFELISYLHWIVCILVIELVTVYNIVVTHLLYLFFLFLHLRDLTLQRLSKQLLKLSPVLLVPSWSVLRQHHLLHI